MRIIITFLLALSLTTPSSAALKESYDKLNAAFPDFVFTNPSGKAAKLSDYQGKVVVVKLWATWCGVCLAKWPRHQALYDKVKNETDVEIITLSVLEDPKVSQAWADDKGYTVPLYQNSINDRGAVKVADDSFYFIKGTPMVFLIDRDGLLRKKVVGSQGEISEGDIRSLL